MVSYSKLKIFNDIIDMMVKPQINDSSNLLDCRLVWRGERYDLIFTLSSQYNNHRILLGAILETCNDLFTWVDISHEVSIVVDEVGRVKYYSYFELIDEVLFNDRYHNYPRLDEVRRLLPDNKKDMFYKWLENKQQEEKERQRREILEKIKEKPKRFFSGNFKFFNI